MDVLTITFYTLRVIGTNRSLKINKINVFGINGMQIKRGVCVEIKRREENINFSLCLNNLLHIGFIFLSR